MSDVDAGYVHRSREAELVGETSMDFAWRGHGRRVLCDERAVKGESVLLHWHDQDMESFYVLEGELTLFVARALACFGAVGSFAHVPGGVVQACGRVRRRTVPSRLPAPASSRATSASRSSVDGPQIKRRAGKGMEFVGPLSR